MIVLIFFCILMPLSAISLRPVLVVEEAEVPGENHLVDHGKVTVSLVAVNRKCSMFFLTI
jgi:hypothetical protein